MFTQKTLDFLTENRFMNSREWFAAHKQEFLAAVYEPLAELANALAPTIEAIDPLIVTEAKTDKTISRVYRDTRFSKDKLLYREEMWLSFKRDKRAYPHYPEFFFVIEPHGFLYGCGYYCATPEAVQSLRGLILSEDAAFQKAREAYEAQNAFVIDGERLKRSKYPDKPESIRAWLDRKNISFISKSNDFSLLYSEQLPLTIANTYAAQKPLYELFIKAEDSKESEKTGGI